MTKRVLRQIRELDAVAERAGGYVAPPGSLKRDLQGERDFSTIRQYSLKHRKPISELTDADYTAMGVRRRTF